MCTWILMHVLDWLQIKVFWYYHGTRNTKSTEKTKKWYVWNYTIKRKWNSQWNVMYFLLWTIIRETEPSMSSDNFDFGDTYGKFLAFSFKKKLLFYWSDTTTTFCVVNRRRNARNLNEKGTRRQLLKYNVGRSNVLKFIARTKRMVCTLDRSVEYTLNAFIILCF